MLHLHNKIICNHHLQLCLRRLSFYLHVYSTTTSRASKYLIFLPKRNNFKILDHFTVSKFSVKAFQTAFLFENSSRSLIGTRECLVTKLQIYQTLNFLFENKNIKCPSWQSLMGPFQDCLENKIARLCLDG